MTTTTAPTGRARVFRTAPDVSTAAGLLRLGNQFCDAQALLTAVQLDLFSTLHDAPAELESVRSRLGVHGRGLSDLLNLLVGLGLLTHESGRYANVPAADRYLVAQNPDSIAGFLLGAAFGLYPAYQHLAEALRTGRPQSGGDFLTMLDDPVATGQFVRMMDGLSQGLVDELVTAVDWSGYRSVLDIGGCRGNVIAHLVRAHAGLRGTTMDLPQMEPFFDEHVAELGVTDSVRFRPGSFFEADLPTADVMIYGHILSDWDRDQRAFLLGKAYDALPAGGTLLVYDRMLQADRNEVENLVASLNMLLMTDGGGEYPVAELAGQAAAAGFSSSIQRALGQFDTLMTFVK